VLRYFMKAASSHHEDEEVDIFPLLERRIADAGESHRFAKFRETLEADHRRLESAWARLRKPLEAIADGLLRPLPREEVQAFVEAYAHHIITEEQALTEFFARWIGDADRLTLGRAMAARRNVTLPPRS
jgi:hemerythrin-like domain-containing protein